MSYRGSDAGAAAGWIVIGAAAAVVGFVGRLVSLRLRIVRR